MNQEIGDGLKMTRERTLWPEYFDIGIWNEDQLVKFMLAVAQSKTSIRVGQIYRDWDANRKWVKVKEIRVEDESTARELIEARFHRYAPKPKLSDRGISCELLWKSMDSLETSSLFMYEGYLLEDYGCVICGAYGLPLRGSSEKAIFHIDEYALDILTLAKELYEHYHPPLISIGDNPMPSGFHGLHSFKVAQYTRGGRLPPGISWVNIYGPRIIKNYGRKFFLEAPGYRVEELGDGGIMYQVSEHYVQWDENMSPSPEEIAAYFKKHPKIKSASHRPVFAREMMTKRDYQKALGARGLTLSPAPSEPPPRHWMVERVEQLAEVAAAAVRLAKESFDIDLDYSPASLKALDDALGSRKYIEEAGLDEESEEAMITTLGAYLGEVVRRDLGGRWELSEDPPSPRLVGLASIEWLDPMARVEKRMREGESASLWEWYRSAQRHSGK